MNPILIDTPRPGGYVRQYLAVDLRNKEVCLVKGGNFLRPVFQGVVKPDSDLFNALPEFWRMYCRVAWAKMGIL